MIVISKMTSGDSIVIDEKPQSSIYDAQARVNRYETLDGGVVVDHQGFVAGDRTIQIVCNPSETDANTLKTLFENETLIHISIEGGFYTGAIQRMNTGTGDTEIIVLLKAAA